MATTILDIPPEVFQKIILYATLGSPLGPPKELFSCLLTCHTFRHRLAPDHAGELYSVIFSQKFDVRGPLFRLGEAVVRENAPLEMRRRFSAIQVFKERALDHPCLTEALWIAYLMVEDSDTSQKNVKQLLRAGVPAFLDMFLRAKLYVGSVDGGWPVLTEATTLALALSWTLASQRVLSDEDPLLRRQMMTLLKPIVYASFRYSIFYTPEDVFSFSNDSRDSTFLNQKHDTSNFPPSMFPPSEIGYFGSVKCKAHPPSAAQFATLLYFTRMESLASLTIPPHIICKTREQANELGITGPCVNDIKHFQEQCRTRFADFPGFDVGIQSPSKTVLSASTLCQPAAYKPGTLSGEWQGSVLIPCIASFDSWSRGMGFPGEDLIDTRFPLYIKLEEHVCYDVQAVVPIGDKEHGAKGAWLPDDLIASETDEGMEFSDSQGTFHTTYETLRRGATLSHDQLEKVVDVIITGKTDEQYVAAWGGYTKILGRVRMQDGLMVLMQTDSRDMVVQGTSVLRGYVTSSQNLVGRLAVYGTGAERGVSFEGVFSLNRNHTGTGNCKEKQQQI
ncbi:hypothetical protein CPC08DRAFT_765718 [Agrocybe pediades]|nr:hypothetical protein CPC08DRAFT_765718 [Agrocybe pediades]